MRRARLVILAASAAALAAGAVGLGARLSRPKALYTLAYTEARQEDFTATWDASGVLEAERSVNVMAPLINARRTLIWTAREGELVRKGDIIARFDPSDLKWACQSAREQLGGYRALLFDTRLEHVARINDLQRKLNTAVQNLKAAQASFESTEFGVELERGKALSKVQQAMAAVAQARNRIASQERQRDFEIATNQELIAQVSNRWMLYSNYLLQLDLPSPADGLVTFPQIQIAGQQRKAQVGDSLSYGQVFIAIPDLFDMNVVANAGEDAIRRLAVGQRADIVLETEPAVHHPGVIRRINPVAQVKKENRFVKSFPVTLRLLREDPKRFKPGLRANLTVSVRDWKKAWTVPMVYLHGPMDEPRCYTVKGSALVEWPLELLDRTERTGVVAQPPPGRLVRFESVDRRVLRLSNVFIPQVAWKRDDALPPSPEESAAAAEAKSPP